ncbi:hypothetical protein JDW15_08490 [Aerococcaceae bacterium zg-ZJ1578]|uniref:hypothetical protein n=1 Tax=Aerococcaceae bacterium zg-252 TaxID=2796928 RepID=UPI001A358121|nr:hypothetical protein [Aerococcaceae bacterium zg-1578]
MGVLRNIYGYSLFVPICYGTKEVACQQKLLCQLMYQPDNAYHFTRFPLVHTQAQYYFYAEWVMRGFLIQNKILSSINQFHYISVSEHQKGQTVFCNTLLHWKPNHSQFENLLYGKQDSFFDKVPIECLYQYFSHIDWEEFWCICNQLFQLKTEADYRQGDITLINEMYESETIIRKCQHNNCFYFSDLLGQGALFKHTFVKLRKPELYKTLYALMLTSNSVREELEVYEEDDG